MFLFFDDGPRSEIREGDLATIRRKYLIHPLVGMRSPTEFERAPDGGAGEVTVYEAYLEAGVRGVIPSLIDEVSSFFSFCPSQLTPLTWRTLMAIQVLGELQGISIGCMRFYTLITLLLWRTKMGSTIFDPVTAPLWSRNL